MTKKRHVKLMRALVTRINEQAKADGYETVKDLYRAVRLANEGLIPEEGREAWWKKIILALDTFGMGDIKEVKSLKAK